MTVDEIVVEISVCVGSAVCGNEELRTVKIRGVYRHQLDLHRPLGKAARLLGLRRFMFGPPVAFVRSLYYTKSNKSVEFSTKEVFL